MIIGNPPAIPVTQEEIEKAARIAMARKAADALHNKPDGVRAKKAVVIAYWRENIGADKSNEFAAELLQKNFPKSHTEHLLNTFPRPKNYRLRAHCNAYQRTVHQASI